MVEAEEVEVRFVRGFAVCLVALGFVAACSNGGGNGGDGGDNLVGAHYYVWYPGNFSLGYLRAELSPPQAPALGEYDSRNASVAEQHIALASANGIDFFTLDWWSNRPSQNEAIEAGFLSAPNIGQTRFAIFYNQSEIDGAPGNGIRFDVATKDRFVADMVTISRRYFGHPSYLRIGGRPVVLVYLSREMHGLFAAAIGEARGALAAEGHDVFLIGDEIFWAVIEADEDPQAPARVTGVPQQNRIALFDAITSYNLYAVERPQDRGYGSTSAFIPDSIELYRSYRDAGGVPIVPGVIPGYNDRATRLGADHFPIPRRWAPDAAEGSFFSEAIDRLGKPFIDDGLKMILITSWNEWNEDTAIEPVGVAPDTTENQLFTQGFAYPGYGTTYLDIVRQSLGD